MSASQDHVRPADELGNRTRSLSQRVATHNQRVLGEQDALAEEVKSLQRALAAAQQDARDRQDADALQELEDADKLVRGLGPGGDLRKLVKQRNPRALQVLLGRNTNVVTLQRSEGIRMKEEYHSFRDRTGYLLFLFSSVLLLGLRESRRRAEAGKPHTLTPPLMVGVQLLLLYMLYFFTGMLLRESVLKVNGSRIRGWWMMHHVVSIFTVAVLLMLPVDSPSVQFTVNKFLWWAWWQSIVMILQNRYQRTRLYTRIALGKAMAMDVVSGESSGNFGQLLLLYPLLFWLQGLQANIGIMMVLRGWRNAISAEGWLDQEQHESDLRGSRGVLLVGVLMLIMASCNFRNTVATIYAKQKLKAQRGKPQQKKA